MAENEKSKHKLNLNPPESAVAIFSTSSDRFRWPLQRPSLCARRNTTTLIRRKSKNRQRKKDPTNGRCSMTSSGGPFTSYAI